MGKRTTIVFNTMGKFFLIFLLFVGFNSNAQKQDNELEISFQDNFNKDNVSLKIENCKIFKNQNLTSREIGFAGITVQFFEPNKILVYENGDIILEKKCRLNLNKEIKLRLKLNGESEVLKINLSNGKFIGINKDYDKEKFKLRQLAIPFEYE